MRPPPWPKTRDTSYLHTLLRGEYFWKDYIKQSFGESNNEREAERNGTLT
ncbi:MAG: hypothetical protein NPIRA05_21750 [Nitrospirales bacterium]|nr:MAG: hypothetical protein NPIRA05_21750 [Nitrospirales bacterium]